MYLSSTDARLRAFGPTVSRLSFAAAKLEAASGALPRALPPLHLGVTTQADLDRLGAGNGAHPVTVAGDEDGYDDPRGAVAERLGRGLQSLVQRFESARRLDSCRFAGKMGALFLVL